MKRSLILIGALLAATLASGASFAAEQTVTRNGTNHSVLLEGGNFTGRARMERYFPAHEGSTTYAAEVTFEPGARTRWHSHPYGQALIVRSGVGLTQEWGKPAVRLYPGDVVWCPPDVRHWHGAAADTAMSHTAIGNAGERTVSWGEEVTEEEYRAAMEETAH